MTPVRRFSLRLLSHLRFNRAERELAREIESHLSLLEESFRAKGMPAADARQAARRAFGGVEQAKEQQRDARSFRWLTGWSMDLRLGARMFVKYPGLTFIGVVALSLGIGAGAAFMEFVSDLLHPSLSFQGGERVIGVVNWDVATGAPRKRSLHEFTQWRGQLTTVTDLGFGVNFQRNLISADGRSEPVKGAEISASAFRIVPSAPLLGRGLTDDDERASAPPVVVIGETLWRSRFGADPAVLGRPVRLGRASYTVVGVMPASFGFPVNQVLWVPLRTNAVYARGEGPEGLMFGRLAPGAGVAAAQAELSSVAERSAGDPAVAQKSRTVVKPYVASMWSTTEDGDMQRYILYAANLIFIGLLGICGANVATLVFARVVTREAEITVRTALGASRGRIVSQLFAEGLVLSTAAAAVGLLIAAFAGRWAKARFIEAQRSTAPFWWTDDLSWQTYIYAGVLAILAAAVVGIVPALKATGPKMQTRLKSAGSTGHTLKFGGVWTGVVIGQVAVTVIFLMSVVSVALNARVSPYAEGNFAFNTDEFVTARLELDPESTQKIGPVYREIERRLELEPGVFGVTQTTRLPGGGAEFIFEFDGGVAVSVAANPLWVRSAFVGADFFDTFQAPIVSGRPFSIADAEQGRAVAIVDETFVRTVLGGRDPLGLRVRQRVRQEDSSAAPWVEIIGVVRDLGTRPGKTSEDAMLYRPAVAGATPWKIDVVVRSKGTAAGLPATVRRVAAQADPTLRLYDVMSLTDYNRVETIAFGFFMRALAGVSAVALLLSSAGVYALMSFTLSRRTREIGIRAALGAAPGRIVTTVFSRAFKQIALGVLAGCIPGYLLVSIGAPEVARGAGNLVALESTAAICLFIGAVAVLACLGPARRALRIHPTDALRAE